MINQRFVEELDALVDKLEREGYDYRDITEAMLSLVPMVLYMNLSNSLSRPATYGDVTKWSTQLSKRFRRAMREAHNQGLK